MHGKLAANVHVRRVMGEKEAQRRKISIFHIRFPRHAAAAYVFFLT